MNAIKIVKHVIKKDMMIIIIAWRAKMGIFMKMEIVWIKWKILYLLVIVIMMKLVL